MQVRVALLILLSIGWLIPMFWASSMLTPLPFRVPNLLWHEYTTGGLFTKRVAAYNEVLIQVRRKNQNLWETPDLSQIAPMCISGYRPRVHRILADSKSKKATESVRLRMAKWVADKVNIQNPDLAVVEEVRYAENIWRTNTPELTQPAGRWRLNVQRLPPTAQFRVVATYRVTDGKAKKLTLDTQPVRRFFGRGTLESRAKSPDTTP